MWQAWAWLSGRYPTIIQDVHKKYGLVFPSLPAGSQSADMLSGNVVRIAPNELSFNTVQAHRDIYSTPTRNTKLFSKDGAFYNNGDSVRVLFYELDPTEHARQRKLIASGFSATAMRSQEHVIHRYVDLLVQNLESLSAASNGLGVDVVEKMLWLGFDIMGSSPLPLTLSPFRDYLSLEVQTANDEG